MDQGKSKLNNNERRRFPRLNVVVVTYSSSERGDTKTVCVTKNISAGGMCLITHERIEVNTELDLEIILPSSTPTILVKGRVVWCQDMGASKDSKSRCDIGIEFCDLSVDARNTIFKYVLSHLNADKV